MAAKMIKLLVNAPTGKQELIEVTPSGGYYDESRVLWDERIDGPFPSGMFPSIGGIVRLGNNLNVDPTLLAAHQAKVNAEKETAQAAVTRKAERLARLRSVDSVTTLPELKALVKDLIQELRILEG